MAPGPNWLTSWIKTNNKHVVHFVPTDGKGKQYDYQEDDTTQASPTTTAASSTTSSFARDFERDNHNVPAHVVGAYSSSSRKQRRRLKKTRSASDLIREMAYTVKAAEQQQASTVVVQNTTGSSQQQQQEPKFLNETAFLQQLEQKMQHEQLLERGETHQSSPRSSVDQHSVARKRPVAVKAVVVLPEPTLVDHLKFFARPNNSIAAQQEQQRTADLENELETALGDLEYMRKVALHNEYTSCQSCNSGAKPPPTLEVSSSALRKAPATTVPQVSKQLAQVVGRHQKQAEQLTKERCKWQHDMHFKLNKYAGLCADLGEESANRNEESIALRQSLDSCKTERDTLSQELLLLRAQAREREKERAEYLQVKQRLAEYEKQGLHHANEAIQSRDLVIANLSSKLEQTLDLLEIERAQRQRRQIIFPAANR